VTRISDLGESAFIKRIEPGCIVRPEGVVCGIGDDCAVTQGPGDLVQLVTTDLLVEGVHFLRDAITPLQLGAKAMAVNLSDIAAMGGRPRDAYLSLSVPTDTPIEYLDAVYDGLKSMAARFQVNLLGGDTTRSPAALVINVTLTGDARSAAVLYRTGARLGDLLFVTGFLGDSAAGLHAILGGHAAADQVAAELVRRHHQVVPQVREGQIIAADGRAHAMLDVSDGLAADLRHLCDRSGVGALIEEDRLPVSEPLGAYCAAHGLVSRELALSGGEDYVLLLAGEPELAASLGPLGVTLFPIGRVVEAGQLWLRRADGRVVPLPPSGWDHFGSTIGQGISG
jgi:thiamine-monophosphate kinase